MCTNPVDCICMFVVKLTSENEVDNFLINSITSEVTMRTCPHSSPSTVCLSMIAGNIHVVSLAFQAVQ